MLKDRNHALATITQAAAEVATSGGRDVFIQGEAWIGKTTLIQAALRELPDNFTSAAAMCGPLQTPRPLGPVRDLTQILFQRPTTAQDEHQIFDSFLRHLQSTQGPTVLVIEDLHWVDQSTLDWLKFIGRRLSQLPVLLIGSFRSDEVDAQHPLRTALNAFPPSPPREPHS